MYDVLHWVGGIVAAYLLFVLVMGIVKGWDAVCKIWFWTKKLFWILFVVAALIFVARALRGKGKKKEEIETKIKEINSIENKTNEDLQKLKELEKERKKAEEDIIDTTKKYQDLIDKLHSKPENSTPKPGDAGKSSDNLTDLWK